MSASPDSPRKSREPRAIIEELLALTNAQGQTLLAYTDRHNVSFKALTVLDFLANHPLAVSFGNAAVVPNEVLELLSPDAVKNKEMTHTSGSKILAINNTIQSMTKDGFIADLQCPTHPLRKILPGILITLKSMIVPSRFAERIERNLYTQYASTTIPPTQPPTLAALKEDRKKFLRNAYRLLVELCDSVQIELPEHIRQTPGAVIGHG